MRKILFLVIFLFPLLTKAQYLTLTPEGFVNTENTEKNYIALQVPGKTSSSLYQDIQSFINQKYNAPAVKDIVLVTNDSIKIEIVEEKVIQKAKGADYFDLSYTLKFSFKDGVVKLEAPEFTIVREYQSNNQTKKDEILLKYNGVSSTYKDGMRYGIYGKTGNLRSKKVEEDLTLYFNTLVAELKAFL